MEDLTPTTPTRNPPGPTFFLGAMAVYLLLVHGLGLFSISRTGPVAPLGEHPEIPAYVRFCLTAFAEAIGHSPIILSGAGLLLLYACMVSLFQLTRRLVKGPVWLGSLAGTAFMAHPVKTEVLFDIVGIYYLAATLLALLAFLSYIYLLEHPDTKRYLLALAIFTTATIPFCINGGLFVSIFLLEFYPATQESRRWERLFPFLTVTMLANWFHKETLYANLPALDQMIAPVLLLIYPIGLLPETANYLHNTPLVAWGWGILAVACLALLFTLVKSGSFRVCLLALFVFRFFPGAESIDFTHLDGGAQLLFPLAMGCVALAGFSRWLMRFEAWRKPTVALTTMLCVVLFILQFQAIRARSTRLETEIQHGQETIIRPQPSAGSDSL